MSGSGFGGWAAGGVEADEVDGDFLEADFVCGGVVFELEVVVFGVDESGVCAEEILVEREEGFVLEIQIGPGASPLDVAGDDIAARCGGVFFHHAGEFRVAFAVGRLVVANSGNGSFLAGLVDPFEGVIVGPVEGTVIDVKGGFAIDKDVVFDVNVSAAADGGGVFHLVEEIADDVGAAEHVVEIDAEATAIAEAGDVVEVVVANHGAAPGPVSTAVNRAGVIRFEADPMDFIQLDQVIVAAKENRHVGCIVNQIVRQSDSDAVD